MTTTFPKSLSPGFSGYSVPSERFVFEKLTHELDGNYCIFHDLLWDDPSIDDSKKAGQADFVVVHPEFGFVALEVKGGRCAYNPELRLWTTVDRDSHCADITDPFDQARSASRVLMKLLLRTTPLRDKFIPHHHAVVFPDCAVKASDLRGDIRAWQLIDRDRLFNLNASITSLFEHSFPDERCAPRTGQLIIEGLRGIFGERPLGGASSMSERIRDISQKVIRLTESQLELVEMFKEHRRLVVRGCAGSGKTTLAMHKARIVSESGQKVLLTCFNRPLGRLLADECATHGNVTAGAFYDLCIGWLGEIGVRVEPSGEDDWWSVTLPNVVADNIDSLRHRFDAIIVDEGQDFQKAWWLVLEMLFTNPAENIFYVFLDGDQNIYHGSTELPMTIAPVILTRNIRNTNQICAAVKDNCRLTDGMRPSGIEGPRVEFREYADEAQMLVLVETILERLIADGFRPADVVILGTRAQHRSLLKYGTKVGPFRLVEQRRKNSELVTMTAHRFKGLESPVVILCELDGETRHNVNDVLYVGMTRAMCLLYVLMKEKTTTAGETK